MDLRRVLSFQPAVMLDAELRVDGARQDDWEALFSLCLPELTAESLVGNIDQASNAFTFTSLNPNLRIGGQGTADVGGRAVKLFGFTINFGTPFVQIAEYQGRLFVRDGYHRCYGVLRKGVTRVPCVLVRAQTFEEIGAARPGFFGYDILFSTRPPFVADFLLDDFSVTLQRHVLRKVIRIKAEEFLLNT